MIGESFCWRRRWRGQDENNRRRNAISLSLSSSLSFFSFSHLLSSASTSSLLPLLRVLACDLSLPVYLHLFIYLYLSICLRHSSESWGVFFTSSERDSISGCMWILWRFAFCQSRWFLRIYDEHTSYRCCVHIALFKEI